MPPVFQLSLVGAVNGGQLNLWDCGASAPAAQTVPESAALPQNKITDLNLTVVNPETVTKRKSTPRPIIHDRVSVEHPSLAVMNERGPLVAWILQLAKIPGGYKIGEYIRVKGRKWYIQVCVGPCNTLTLKTYTPLYKRNGKTLDVWIIDRIDETGYLPKFGKMIPSMPWQ